MSQSGPPRAGTRLTASIETDPTKKALEEAQYQREFSKEFDFFMQRRTIYEDNRIKAYALLWERCSKAMQNKIQSRKDFDSKIYTNPILLKKAIKNSCRLYTIFVPRVATSYPSHTLTDPYHKIFKECSRTFKKTTNYKAFYAQSNAI